MGWLGHLQDSMVIVRHVRAIPAMHATLAVAEHRHEFKCLACNLASTGIKM